jgi:molybdenum cofactor biosynthesis enzyme MoaA
MAIWAGCWPASTPPSPPASTASNSTPSSSASATGTRSSTWCASPSPRASISASSRRCRWARSRIAPPRRYTSEQIRARIEPHFTLIPTTETTGGPARYYRIPDSPTRIGFISPHSHNFCADCNRVRVTSEGQLLLCLGREESLDLRAILRQHPGDEARLRQAIIEALCMKPEGHGFATGIPAVMGRPMNHIGG